MNPNQIPATSFYFNQLQQQPSSTHFVPSQQHPHQHQHQQQAAAAAAIAAAISTDTSYPSTLLPSRQIFIQPPPPPPPPLPPASNVKLLQSCDSCRRRKVKCSGERPTCEACIKYQETCHYSPLSAPRKRIKKRPKTESIEGEEGAEAEAEAEAEGVDGMRREIKRLNRRLDEMDGKVNTLLETLDRQPAERALDPCDNDGFYDRYNRFGLDTTNVKNIRGLVNRIDSARQQQRTDEGAYGLGGGVFPGVLQRLETPTMQCHLVEAFYANADLVSVAPIPRSIFNRLQQQRTLPRCMVNVMRAEACNYSDDQELVGIGREFARGYFIEQAYKSLFDCLEYDSVEHCVALLLFSILISKAGLHRAWIMTSLSMDMSVRLRFHAIDSSKNSAMFGEDTKELREWKRRVFWQLATVDLQYSSLNDLPPSLPTNIAQCQVPRGFEGEGQLGPAFVISEDQGSLELQVRMLRIIWGICDYQNRLVPEQALFGEDFDTIYESIVGWQRELPKFDILENQSLGEIARAFRERPGLVVVALHGFYAQISLCMVKESWLPTTREMTDGEKERLEWTRRRALELAQKVHRLLPFVKRLPLCSLSPSVVCVVFQACVVSVQAHSWGKEFSEPSDACKVRRGIEYLESTQGRWGYAGILIGSLKGMIVERGFATDGPEEIEEAVDAEIMSEYLKQSKEEQFMRYG